MRLYDRYSSRTVDSAMLPTQIDLGRYSVCESGEDITNRIINVGNDKFIRQGILERDNKSIQDLFCQFNHMVGTSGHNQFNVKPLIQSIKDKLYLNDFEKMLEDKLFHLEEIFRQPHYLLNRTIEKVNVSRAKRIPAKSYQNLASHTEDWLHKSIVNFKPRRILNEELDLLYDVYENQVTVALIERCLLYLGGRVKEIHDISEFLVEYESILSARDDERGWYKKIDRNLSLIGEVYEDNNFNGEVDRTSILTETQKRLIDIQKRLRALQGTSFYDEVNKRVVMSLMAEREVRPTNVIANHKHYRYVRELWLSLNTVDKEQSEDERAKYEQNVITGVRYYAKACLTYLVKEVLGYTVSGTYQEWHGLHDHYCPISLKDDSHGCIEMEVGKNKLRFVTIASEYSSGFDVSKNPRTYILSLGYKGNEKNVIDISPYDADSVERIGRIVREYMLRDYLDVISISFKYSQVLKDYVRHVQCEQVAFSDDYSYRFLGLPENDIVEKEVMAALERNDAFSERSRPEKDSIRTEMRRFVRDVNSNIRVVLKLIKCQSLDCGCPAQRRDAKQLNYLSCHCGFVLYYTNGHVVFKNKDPKYECLSQTDWGMDYVEFDM